MDPRTHVYLSHTLNQFDDMIELLQLLEPTLPAIRKVSDYWQSMASLDSGESQNRWHPLPVTPNLGQMRKYSAPGNIELAITPSAARMSAAVSWQNFLRSRELRQTHLVAFEAIARALASPTMVLCSADRENVSDLFEAGATFQEFTDLLHSSMGDPQQSIRNVSTEVTLQAREEEPIVWYLETIGY